jgi:hypothetical protein
MAAAPLAVLWRSGAHSRYVVLQACTSQAALGTRRTGLRPATRPMPRAPAARAPPRLPLHARRSSPGRPPRPPRSPRRRHRTRSAMLTLVAQMDEAFGLSAFITDLQVRRSLRATSGADRTAVRAQTNNRRARAHSAAVLARAGQRRRSSRSSCRSSRARLVAGSSPRQLQPRPAVALTARQSSKKLGHALGQTGLRPPGRRARAKPASALQPPPAPRRTPWARSPTKCRRRCRPPAACCSGARPPSACWRCWSRSNTASSAWARTAACQVGGSSFKAGSPSSSQPHRFQALPSAQQPPRRLSAAPAG